MRCRATGAATCLITILAVTGCSSDDSPAGTPGADAAAPGTGSPAPTPIERTPELDSMAVMGHSGATGAGSDGTGADVPNNSWATGSNPEVNSIYRRLLTTHPALEGHNANVARSGSDVNDLKRQLEALATVDPVPDLVIIQSIDNDIRCDGSDPDNYDDFEETLDEVLTMLEDQTDGAQVFFVDQWTSVKTYTNVIADIPRAVAGNSGTGPCDVFTPDGRRNPEAEAYLQGLVDTYFGLIVDVCSRHVGCYTDDGALQRMPLTRGDLISDLNHLSVQGLHKMAEHAWAALPDAIREQP
jgi:hypothetical protein